MKVEIDKYSGFCFGVVNAIQMAEDELKKGKSLYCLGYRKLLTGAGVIGIFRIPGRIAFDNLLYDHRYYGGSAHNFCSTVEVRSGKSTS